MRSFADKSKTQRPMLTGGRSGSVDRTKRAEGNTAPQRVADARADSSRAGRDFSRVPCHCGGCSKVEGSKSSESSPGTDEEVTAPAADAGTATPADAGPKDAGVPDAAPAKKAKLKSGPTYSPSGTITATKSGGSKTAAFDQSAEFEHDPANGIYANVGEIRQYIKWTAAEDPPATGAFSPKASFPGDTWYEDRDPAGKRYGHRSGTFAECVSINHYEDSAGTKDCANGAKYVGRDTPVGAMSRTGKWSFELRAVDTVSGAEIGTPAKVAVDWNVP